MVEMVVSIMREVEGNSTSAGQRSVLEVEGLTKVFPVRAGILQKIIGELRAVDDVSLVIKAGETFGLVGESGCGKSTLARCILRSIPATSGRVIYHPLDGSPVDLFGLAPSELRNVRAKMQMVFQDPYSSLDPRMSVLDIIGEPLSIIHTPWSQLVERVQELMKLVGLNPQYMRRYPHAFSGGQRQRIAVARALATQPRFIVCDEPVSALDVSVRAQVINLLLDLQAQLGIAYLLVSHDIGVIRHVSHTVGVMYLGKLVEMAPSEELFASPKHPYTAGLLESVLEPDPRQISLRAVMSGEVPNPTSPPSGCHFHPRCRFVQDICRREVPKFEEISQNHSVACHFSSTISLQGI